MKKADLRRLFYCALRRITSQQQERQQRVQQLQQQPERKQQEQRQQQELQQLQERQLACHKRTETEPTRRRSGRTVSFHFLS